ncbi:class I SAM-dependent methyltransferase [Runella sp.]|uniref:class I SAM-dependent methyltransferase n=1 Tax=Runella sp. TaxID=1960881 RepID=UPI0030188293
MSQKWDERYAEPEFAYGKEPNEFFKTWLPNFEPGTILMPAEGEGRNGVFAARIGWNVTAFDLSIEGKSKALKLAQEHHVTLDYTVGDFEQLDLGPESFDAIGLIYAHFPGAMKSAFHHKLDGYLKPGGAIIFEAFSKRNLQLKQQNPKVGGPDDLNTLFSTAEIAADFHNYEILLLEEAEIELNEGKYHIGTGSVVRFVGRKK